jgi:predicted RecB family nuclease
MFSGVSGAVATELTRRNITSAVELANANPDSLVSDTISAAAALRMVEEARKVVPAQAWSLNSAQIGLSQSAQTALAKNGITTLGELRTAATGEGKSSIAKLLGASATQVKNIASQIDQVSLQITSVRKTGAAVTSVFGVGAQTGAQLANAGFGTTGALAAADPKKLASFFGGDAKKAAEVVAAAKKIIAG